MTLEQERESTKIMLDKLEEMANITLDDCDSVEGYAAVCSVMCDIYRTLTDGK